MKNHGVLFLAVVGLALLQGGCGGGGSGVGGGPTGGGTLGRLFVRAEFEDATRIVPGYADLLRVTVTPPAGVALPGTFPSPFVLARASAMQLLDGLEPSHQPYVLDMEALTDGTVVGTARRSIVVTAGLVREIDVSANLQSEIASITVEGASSLIFSEGQYTAFAKNAQGATLFSGAGFSFTSSNPAVLAIDPVTGFATAYTFGTATLTAILLGTSQSGQLAVTVENGTKIVYMGSVASYDVGIMVMSTDGLQRVRLTDFTSYEMDPSFSHDGSKIVHVSWEDGSYGIYTMNADGSGQTLLSNFPNIVRYPKFSYDGSEIVFESSNFDNSEIYIMNADGTGQTQLTNNTYRDSEPAPSPDGSKIVFMSERDGNPEIYIMNADGSGQMRLTNDPAIDRRPMFSPDGSKIAFHSGRDGNTGIYVMNPDGSGLTRLTAGTDGEGFPAYSADGSKIAFAAEHGEDWDIYVMNADGTERTQLTSGPGLDYLPSFGGAWPGP